MDHLRSQPDAGLKSLPYAKSKSARWKLLVLVGLVGLAGFFFGLIGALIAMVVAVPLGWSLEHHFFFQRSTGDDNTEASPGDGPPSPEP